MRRTGRSALAQGVVALAVMAAGVVVVVTDDEAPVARAETVLGNFHDIKITSSAGTVRPAVTGERIANGDIITTGPHGAAELITRHRLTMLGSNAALVVTNGGQQQLRTGTAVVDAQRGPGLDLDLSGNTVAIPHGSGTEAIRGVSVRIGALVGPAEITSTSGRRLALPALSQAVLSGDALPGGTTPLHLTDSVEEDRVAHRLVSDDRALKALARGIDTTGRSTARVIAASWTGVSQPVPDRANRSERVLPVLIANSTHVGSAQQRYNNAVVWRAEGGSWGVILHLLSGRASAVESTLAALQRTDQSPGRIGTVQPPSVVSAAGPTAPTGLPSPPATEGGDGSSPPTGSSPRHGGTPASPPPPDNVLGSVVSTVQNVLDSVFALLPHEKSTGSGTTTKPATTAVHRTSSKVAPVATRAKPASEPTPTTAPAKPPVATATPSNGLLGNVLGGLLGGH